MRVIPVIDLKGGTVVRAHGGDRANYAPIDTSLSPGTSDPVAIARALLSLSPAFDSLYVADIDAITSSHRDSVPPAAQELADALPGVRILLDHGAARPADVAPLAQHASILPVIGTETLTSIASLVALAEALPRGFALSLDWGANSQALGPHELFEASELWPQTIIVMTLDRVGSQAGPDFSRLDRIKQMAGNREVLAAGGIRGVQDLRKLNRAGCGALVATALHDGSLSSDELASLAK